MHLPPCAAPLAAPAASLDTSAWVAVAVALALAVAVAGMLWLRRRVGRRWSVRRAHLRRATPRYPVVLAHGLLGFDEIRIGAARHHYFRGVSARLEREGCVVHRCRVARAASVADRAAELAAFVRAVPARRVNLVAHSMGGLDARHALARLGLAGKVVSLTTVGTPHRGTPLADVGAASRVLPVLERLGLGVAALDDLTTARMAAFNRAAPDVRGVFYASVVGAPAGRRAVSPLLQPSWLWLAAEGANDGMVPAASQRWGELLREIDADHLAQIGWSRRFDAAEFYAELLRELRGRGL